MRPVEGVTYSKLILILYSKVPYSLSSSPSDAASRAGTFRALKKDHKVPTQTFTFFLSTSTLAITPAPFR